MCLHGDVFPSWDSNLGCFDVDGGFPHSPGSTGSGHFFYTIVSRLGSCCKFSHLVSLLDNRIGVSSTKVMKIVLGLHTMNQPLLRLELTTHQRPYILVAKYHCYSCSLFIGSVVPIHTCKMYNV